MRRDKLHRRNLHAAKLYSKWVLRRMGDQLLAELTERAFAEWRKEVDEFRPISLLRYGIVSGRERFALFSTAAS